MSCDKIYDPSNILTNMTVTSYYYRVVEPATIGQKLGLAGYQSIWRDMLMVPQVTTEWMASVTQLVSEDGFSELIWPLLVFGGLLYVCEKLGDETDGRKR